MPLKKKFARANEASFMDTKLNHAIMVHLEFQCTFLKRISNNTRLHEVSKKFLAQNIR